MVASLKKERKLRTEMAIADPSTLPAICEFLADGGTLSGWCRSRDVRYWPVHQWLASDAQQAVLKAAVLARQDGLSDLVVDGLVRVVKADVRKAVDKRGCVLPIKKQPDEIAFAMTGVKVTEDREGGVTTELKMTPRDRGFEMLGRHLGLFKPDTQISVEVGYADRLSKARERAAARKA